MKLLICNQHRHDIVGGSEIQCDLIARRLSQRGHEVVYAALKSGRQLEKQDYGYRIVAVPEVNVQSLHELIERERPELLYWRYNRNYFLPVALLCALHKIKSVYAVSSRQDVDPWHCGPAQQTVNPLRKGLHELKRLVQRLYFRADYEGYRHFDGVISLSKDLLHRVPSPPGGPRHRTYIHNSMERAEWQEFDWPRPYVAWVANLRRCKRPEAFVELARELEHLPVDFLMVGELAHETYNYLSDPSNWPAGFHYLGPRPLAEVNGLVKGARCLVHTCEPEGFGNIFIQAWQQKTATVSLSFDPDGLIEAYGLGFVSRSREQLAKDVSFLVHHEALRREMGARAQVLAKRLFDPAANVTRLERFFEEVLYERAAEEPIEAIDFRQTWLSEEVTRAGEAAMG